MHRYQKKSDMRGKIGISLYGGGNIPTNGDYSSNVKTTAYIKLSGSQFGLGAIISSTKVLVWKEHSMLV